MILLFARALGWFPSSGFADPSVNLGQALAACLPALARAGPRAHGASHPDDPVDHDRDSPARNSFAWAARKDLPSAPSLARRARQRDRPRRHGRRPPGRLPVRLDHRGSRPCSTIRAWAGSPIRPCSIATFRFIQATVFVIAAVVMLANLTVDLLYLLPRSANPAGIEGRRRFLTRKRWCSAQPWSLSIL